jgi:hypothetical protein
VSDGNDALHLHANNLFVRYRFGQTFPGDMSGKSAVNEPALGYLPPMRRATAVAAVAGVLIPSG